MTLLFRKLKKLRQSFGFQETPAKSQFFLLERSVLQTCGYWPMDSFFNFKFLGTFVLSSIFNFIPKINFAKNAVLAADFKSFASIVPELMMHFWYVFMIFCLVSIKSQVRVFYDELAEEWKLGEFL